VAKSIISALIGIAIEKGFIESIDRKVLEFFPDYKAAPSDFRKRSVTVRQLLTMTAPIASKSIGSRWEPLDRLRRQPDWTRYALGLLGKGEPGRFQYSTVGTHLLSSILTRATGMSTREFANEYLFRPIGIKEIPDCEMKSFLPDDVFGKNVRGWIKDPQGISTGGFGITITPRDMARFGYLYLNGGVWDGRPVIPAEWIKESTASNPNNYGYLWWLKESNGIFSYAAIGSGGSMICCIPQLDIVVAIASKIVQKPRDPWILIQKCIIPAYI
jgi:CubicO group peptidase (beta-lactamase class C family)